MTARMSEKPTIVDNEGLSDADWAEANRLLRAYDAGGSAAFWRAMDELGNADPIRWFVVAGAFGFLTFSHTFDGPDASSFFETMPSRPSLQTALNIPHRLALETIAGFYY